VKFALFLIARDEAQEADWFLSRYTERNKMWLALTITGASMMISQNASEEHSDLAVNSLYHWHYKRFYWVVTWNTVATELEDGTAYEYLLATNYIGMAVVLRMLVSYRLIAYDRKNSIMIDITEKLRQQFRVDAMIPTL